ncbi:hypothetical protein GJR96_05170 [Haloferax sp. MBLA0076]|uniref:Uncharacterized protein n=1 Tax=Haloferax litoreum TaxID=2666140 RepID=A0A6A8GFU1_9EURY|nr:MULTISPECIES: hypothetical protein [Haloferax]KAB1192868.1 hypothetical protein Hfx1148_05170 [Haloferax sp. CBA1148]MRX21352.1 hypothetical protein [Haloferax litoreum]
MSDGSSKQLNRFGYAVGLCTVLAVSFLVLGGTAYAIHALVSFVTALFVLSWAMRRTRRQEERQRDSDPQKADEEKRRNRREREMKAKHGTIGGGGGDGS